MPWGDGSDVTPDPAILAEGADEADEDSDPE
jgi:hypothetical protein